MTNISTTTTAYKLTQNGVVVGEFPTLALAEAAALLTPGSYDIETVIDDVVTAPISAPASPVSVAFAAPTIAALVAPQGTVLAGGLDGGGSAYSLLPAQLTWNGQTFVFGKVGAASAVANVSLPLPGAAFAALYLLATSVNGNSPNAVFVVTYTDGTTAKITQSLSDWFFPAGFTGETPVSTMASAVSGAGTVKAGPCYLYGYTLPLDATKTVKSLTLPASRNVVVLAVTLGPAPGVAAGAPAAEAAWISAKGNIFVDSRQKGVQHYPRGFNTTGLEGSIVLGASPVSPDPGAGSFPWGFGGFTLNGQAPMGKGVEPDWDQLDTLVPYNWVRIAYNEACVMGYKPAWRWSSATAGAMIDCDPYNDMLATMDKTIADLYNRKKVCYFDLHCSAPDDLVPGFTTPQHVACDRDSTGNPNVNTLAALVKVATRYAAWPNFVMNLFNEIEEDDIATGQDPWNVYLNGGPMKQYQTASGAHPASWTSMGLQKCVDAVRGAGYKGMIGIPAPNWDSDFSKFLQYTVKDPLNNFWVECHTYAVNPVGSANYGTLYAGVTQYWDAILAKYPGICGEYNWLSTGGTTDDFGATWLAWATARKAMGTLAFGMGPYKPMSGNQALVYTGTGPDTLALTSPFGTQLATYLKSGA